MTNLPECLCQEIWHSLDDPKLAVLFLDEQYQMRLEGTQICEEMTIRGNITLQFFLDQSIEVRVRALNWLRN